MPALLTQASQVQCPHGAVVTHVPSNTRVVASGSPVLVMTDTNTIAGCAFTLPSTTPSPCVTVRWTVAAARVKVMGQPVLLQSSVGLCTAATQAPQGPPIVGATQPRVQGI
ncbi:MAG: hypothetical protein ACE37F_19515 [Nannocystaceae bacterium]|nr:hypothetical protein [bacterium]